MSQNQEKKTYLTVVDNSEAVETFEPSSEIKSIWKSVYKKMREEFGEAIYRSWLKPLTLQAYYHNTLEISVPTRFMKDWIATHYLPQIVAMCAEKNEKIQRIELVVVARAYSEDESDIVDTGESDILGVSAETTAPAQSQLAKDILDATPLDPRYRFENFVIGQSNALSHAAARRVVESESMPFNPLFIYGGVGLGKTHLMHAMAWELKEKNPNKTVIYLSAEKFMYQFVKAVRSSETMQFKDLFRSVDVLMIDDIQFISGKEATQEEFFHTFNALVDQNKQIIISADRSPQDLDGIDERLRSRLSWGLVADIGPTTYELRLGVLKAKCDMMDVQVPDTVLEFLALKVTSNIRELEGALNRIIAHADITKQSVTLETTQNVLQDLLRSHDRRITIDEIQRKVTDHFRLKLSDMHSSRRSRNIARPRQIAMYLSKQLTTRSLPEIGRKFGGRDHTTVMHAIRKIEELMDEDRDFAQDVDILRRTLTG